MMWNSGLPVARRERRRVAVGRMSDFMGKIGCEGDSRARAFHYLRLQSITINRDIYTIDLLTL
jgi:hypothetical protein